MEKTPFLNDNSRNRLAGLIYEDDINLTPKDISSILKVACEPLDNLQKNHQGDGKINIKLILK